MRALKALFKHQIDSTRPWIVIEIACDYHWEIETCLQSQELARRFQTHVIIFKVCSEMRRQDSKLDASHLVTEHATHAVLILLLTGFRINKVVLYSLY